MVTPFVFIFPQIHPRYSSSTSRSGVKPTDIGPLRDIHLLSAYLSHIFLFFSISSFVARPLRLPPLPPPHGPREHDRVYAQMRRGVEDNCADRLCAVRADVSVSCLGFGGSVDEVNC